jgi:hypothetical protein
VEHYAEVHTDGASALEQCASVIGQIAEQGYQRTLGDWDKHRLAVVAAAAALAMINAFMLYDLCKKEFVKRGIAMAPVWGSMGPLEFTVNPAEFGIVGLDIVESEGK